MSKRNERIYFFSGREELHVGFVEDVLKCFYVNWQKYNQKQSSFAIVLLQETSTTMKDNN